MLVSVALCTYNGERFLKEQLDSILNQSFKNIELIVTDDCSSDKTIEILKSYQKNDTRIKIYQNETNLGFLKNFEKSISLCTGEYIALADQDDIWKENKLEVFIQNIGKNVLIYSDVILIDADGKELGRPNGCLVTGNINKAFLLSNCVSGNTLMFKKELVKHILPIPPKMSYHDIWIAFVATTYGTITYTKEPMTYYRRYAEQVTNSPQVVYKSFFDKLKQKKEARIHGGNVIAQNLAIFLTLDILTDKETIKIIKLLKDHFEQYEDIYYNYKLYKILKKNRNEVFAITKPAKRKRRAFRTSTGLKLRTMTLFKL